MKSFQFVAAILILLTCSISTSRGDLVVGVISDFQDGTLQGWGGGTVSNVANSGPQGAGDNSLQLSNGGAGNRFAMRNNGVNGIISSDVSAIASDIFRPTGQGIGEIRLVLFDTDGTRWTSTTAANVVDDGLWNNYSFSIRESDLTVVQGAGSYASLTNNLARIMLRYDPGVPSPGGSSLAGTMNFDNITAVPEPTTGFVLALGMVALGAGRRRRQ